MAKDERDIKDKTRADTDVSVSSHRVWEKKSKNVRITEIPVPSSKT